jgi:5'-nucleotidase/UDP-sugar diphosphatase
MKTAWEKPAAAAVKKIITKTTARALSRRDLVAGSAVVGATLLRTKGLFAAADRKITFTILHTNDMHSYLLGTGPVQDYRPLTLNADQAQGGYARLATLIAQRKAAHKEQGPVLLLDDGDYSMGTAFAAATRETGVELQIMSLMGYDAVTFGNHEFDMGPEGLGRSVGVAAAAGRIPAVVASNLNVTGTDATLADLQRLTRDGVVRRYIVIERGGLRFGIFGVLGKEAIFFCSPGAHSFSDFIEAAKETVTLLRQTEKVDVVIALSHGGLKKSKDGRYTEGDDVRLAEAVPGIDVVVSGHSHTVMQEPTIVNDRTPVVQAGKYGQHLGELVISLGGGKLTVESWQLHPINGAILGDSAIQGEIEKFKQPVTAAVFASRGYSIDQPLAVVLQDFPVTHDIASDTPLANLCTDAFRHATKADIALSANGLMLAPFTRGKSGVQTVYDVFSVMPLGAGVVDPTAGSALMTVYLDGQNVKHVLDFFLIEIPGHEYLVGELFPRSSGLRFRYDSSRPTFDVVTAIEVGDLEHGYRAIDITGADPRLYSVVVPEFFAKIAVNIPKYSKGKLPLVFKSKTGQPFNDRVETIDYNAGAGIPFGGATPDLLPPDTIIDPKSINTKTTKDAVREIKAWEAIMDHLRNLPVKTPGELPIIPFDERATEVRAIKVG